MRLLLLRRLLLALASAFVVASVVFVLIRLAPGDPFASALDNPAVTDAVRERWRAAYGLDQPIATQYARFIVRAAQGDFGYSFTYRETVGRALLRALPNTILLMGTALLLSFALGIAIGVAQAARRGTLADRAISGVTMLLYSLPDFWLALMVLLLLAYRIPVFPVGGTIDTVMYEYFTPLERLLDRARHLALPALVLTVLTTGAVARHQRAALVEVAGEDYLRTARAKGLGARDTLWRHALRNALLPIITLGGLAVPALLGGAVFVERVFAWPGMGLLAVNAVASRDYPLVTATVIVASLAVSAGALIADLLQAAVDPRVRPA